MQQAIQPMQQFAYTNGKNSTDSALIIDAMDLLYSGNLEAFAIVSSDSDFTRLAMRLRESGATVYGLGRRKTPQSFQTACDRFIFLENSGRRGSRTRRRRDEPAPPAAETCAALMTKAVESTVGRRRLVHHVGGRQLPRQDRPVVRPPHLQVRQAEHPGQGAGLPGGRVGSRNPELCASRLEAGRGAARSAPRRQPRRSSPRARSREPVWRRRRPTPMTTTNRLRRRALLPGLGLLLSLLAPRGRLLRRRRRLRVHRPSAEREAAAARQRPRRAPLARSTDSASTGRAGTGSGRRRAACTPPCRPGR